MCDYRKIEDVEEAAFVFLNVTKALPVFSDNNKRVKMSCRVMQTEATTMLSQAQLQAVDKLKKKSSQ